MSVVAVIGWVLALVCARGWALNAYELRATRRLLLRSLKRTDDAIGVATRALAAAEAAHPEMVRFTSTKRSHNRGTVG